MKKTYRKIALILLFSILLIILSSCTSNDAKDVEAEAVDLMNANWDAIVEEAKGQTVNFHLWGGSSLTNRYLDEWVAPRLKEQYDITLNRVPADDAIDMINKVLTEKEVDKKDGSVDMWWINGENFKLAKDNDLLWDSFAEKLPNYQKYIDKDAPDNRYDFGVDTEQMEVPWGKAQFVMIYDSAKVKEPPKNIEELRNWIKENPGKFTYPAPPDFTGSVFVRHVWHAHTDKYDEFLNEGKEDELRKDLAATWEYLNDIKPYLWRKGENYPESSGKLDKLFSSGEVWMTMSYNPVHALSKIRAGEFPETTRTFIFDKGTIANTHYLSIPFNSQSKAAAMVAINLMISPDAQISKFDPEYWGDGIALSIDKLSDEDKEKLDKIDLGEPVLPLDVISKNRIPEVMADYIDIIEEEWINNVAK